MTDQPPSNEELYHLRRIQLLEDLKQDLNEWGRKRFWVVVVVASVVGIIGINSLVFATIYNVFQAEIKAATKAVAKAELSADRADTAATAAEQKTEDLDKLISDISKNATVVKEQVTRVQADIDAASIKVTKLTQTATGGLELRLTSLEDAVKGLASATRIDLRTQEGKSFAAVQSELKATADQKTRQFEENFQYTINVTGHFLDKNHHTALFAHLTDLGYETRDYAGVDLVDLELANDIEPGMLKDRLMIIFPPHQQNKAEELRNQIAAVYAEQDVALVASERPRDDEPNLFEIYLPE